MSAAPERPIELVGLDRDGLAGAMAALDVPERQRRMRAGQLWHWLYHHGATSFDPMTTISKDFRQVLAERCHVDACRHPAGQQEPAELAADDGPHTPTSPIPLTENRRRAWRRPPSRDTLPSTALETRIYGT